MSTFSPMMIPLPTAHGDLPLWDARANLRAQLAEGEGRKSIGYWLEAV